MRSSLQEDEVAAFEARNGLRLPENYRRYLLEFGDPASGLMRYAAQPFGEKDDPGHRKPFPLHEPWAGWPDVITEWEEEEGTDFFDDGPGEFYAQFDDPAQAFYDLPSGADPDDGTLILGATRSHMLARLVLNGPWAGTVWLDSFGYDGQLKQPADDSYDDLYDNLAPNGSPQPPSSEANALSSSAAWSPPPVRRRADDGSALWRRLWDLRESLR